MSFFTEYFDIVGGKTEEAVCCPFPHYTSSGDEYSESHPSAHVNTVENLFHCKVCNAGGSEVNFIQQILGCKYVDAKRIQRCFDSRETRELWKEETLSEASKARALALGISEEVINELELKTPPATENHISFPVFMYGQLLDTRNYNPGGTPKIRSRTGAISGLIVPFDTWLASPLRRVTLICAGEKDMAIARSNGFNAITLTGGENALPKQLNYFKNRVVAIVYDNDAAGKAGAVKLARELSKVASEIKVVTNFHENLAEHEDITDFFTKYHLSKEQLKTYIDATPLFEATQELEASFPIMDLLTASQPANVNKLVRSNVQIVAISEATFICPKTATGEKFMKSDDKGDIMTVGDCREWELTSENVEDVLHLVDNNFSEDEVIKNMKVLMKIPIKERCIKIKHHSRVTIFKCSLTDMFETNNTTNSQPMEYLAYSLDHKLESGQKYMVTYKLVPHPYKGQQLIMLITDVKNANDSVTNFKLTEEVKASLAYVQNIPGTPKEKIHALTEKVKGLLGYNGNNTLITAIDLGFHTPLRFHFGNFHDLRGYLDMIIVGESRTGKSSTADILRQTYGLGCFTSLAGNSATIPGLVGGSNKTASGYQTRAGIIPQNHKGLIIFEEFGKSNQNIIKELTDIRSSNEVRITRVSGTITLPAMVRMMSLTNPKNINGQIKSIASYPNGIAVLTDLVETAEDIARYDLIVILSERGNAQIDPLWEPDSPLDTQLYRDRIRWVWSRTADQINITKDVALYVINRSNEINKELEGHIKIFGTEAWKKITRLSVAIAGYLASSDESFENIVVTKDHVDFAIEYMLELYDNQTFKLKEYIHYEKQYTEIDEEGQQLLQNLYDKFPMLIIQLEQHSEANKNVLTGATGYTADELNKALNALAKGLFIKFSNYNVIPTERFRLGLAKLERNTFVTRIGENYAETTVDTSGY